jgi:hypothetical protein
VPYREKCIERCKIRNIGKDREVSTKESRVTVGKQIKN